MQCDEKEAKWESEGGSSVPLREPNHSCEAYEDLPLGKCILNEPVAQVFFRETINDLSNHEGDAESEQADYYN